MTETTPGPEDSLPTEPLQLTDQQPIDDTATGAVPAPPAKSSHRTILAVVGAAVAVSLIALSGIVGFAIGSTTGDRNDDTRLSADRSVQDDQGNDARGIDPDGDNWTGGGQGHQGRGGEQGAMPGQGTMPDQGVIPQQSASPTGA